VKYIILALLLTGCTGLPSMSLTPVSADLTVGGTHETGIEEESFVKVATGDSVTSSYTADLVKQTYTDVQEYPMWLVLAFAFAVGMALPSPIAAYGAWRQRRILEKQITMLTELISASQPQTIKEPHHGSTTDSNITSAS
jgi:hypothetical protein